MPLQTILRRYFYIRRNAPRTRPAIAWRLASYSYTPATKTS